MGQRRFDLLLVVLGSMCSGVLSFFDKRFTPLLFLQLLPTPEPKPESLMQNLISTKNYPKDNSRLGSHSIHCATTLV